MADRYWVGGTGTWNSSNTANWSATSGGAGGASTPGSGDNVFFDANSGTGTITLGTFVSINDFDCTGFIGTFAGSSSLTVYGTIFKLVSGMTYTMTGTVSFYNSTAGATVAVTSAGKTIQSILIGRSSTPASTTFALQDNLTLTGFLFVDYGTFSTNNYNVTAAAISSSNTNVRSINLGSSTVTLTGTTPWSTSTTTNLTFNAGTSTINVTNVTTPTFTGNLTFYNVNFTGGGIGQVLLYGTNTFNNLSFTADTTGTRTIVLGTNQTINGSLTTSGTTSTQRVQFRSDVAGTQRTLSVATIGTLTNTNWQDIALTGAASPWSAPIGVYDLGNNSGITFDTTTLYWVGGTGNWTDGTRWSTSSGGSAANVVPGPTNNVIFNSASNATAYTVTMANGYCKDITATAPASGKLTLTPGGQVYIYGSVDLSAGSAAINNISGGTFNFLATTTGKTLNFATLGPASACTFNGVGGEWTLQSSLLIGGGGSLVLNAGSLNTNGYAVSFLQFSATASTTASLSLGSSAVTVSSTVWNASGSGFTLNAGTSTITFSNYTGALTFNGGGKTYYNVVFTLGDLTYTSALAVKTLTGTNTFNNLTFSGATTDGVCGVALTDNQTITGTLTTSCSALRRVVFFPTDYVTTKTITAAAVSLTDTDFVKITGAGAASWTGTRLGNGGGNSNITFDAPKTVYWNVATGGPLLSASWATSSGGSVAANNVPLAQDTAIVEDTGLNSGATLSTAVSGFLIPNITFATRTLPVTWAISNNPFAPSNITLSSAVTRSGTSLVYFSGNTTLTSAGITWTNNIVVFGTLTISDTATFNQGSTHTVLTSGTLTLNANATFSATSIAQNGVLNLNTYTLTMQNCTLGAASTTNFGTGKIVLTGNARTILTSSDSAVCTGSKVVECTYSGSTGTRTFTSFSLAESSRPNIKITGGTDTINTNSMMIGDLDFTGFSGTLTNTTRYIAGSLTLSSGMTLLGGVGVTVFNATSGTKTITTNGKTLDFLITFNGVGGTWQLADNLTMGSLRNVTLTNGTVDLNGKTLNIGASFETASGTKNLTFNGGTLLLTGASLAFNNVQPANFTTTAGTGTGKISMTAATAKSFVGGGSTYNCTLENAGAGALTVTGSNTFTTISNSVQPTSFLFTAGTTTTVTNFNVAGTSGNLVTIGSATASNHTLSKSSGTVSVQYCSISRSTATGGATWEAFTSNGNVDGGNNSGWKFSSFSGNGLFFGSNF